MRLVTMVGGFSRGMGVVGCFPCYPLPWPIPRLLRLPRQTILAGTMPLFA